MVIAAEVQKAVQDELREFFFQSETVFLGLPRRLRHADHHIAQRSAGLAFPLILF